MRAIAWLCLLLAGHAVCADERILEFHSDVLVRADGWIEVRETITVMAEGREIRRGIYRDFPTRYRDRQGLDYVVDYQPLALLRNARPEPFHSVDLDNGVRTYFGSRDRFLDPGRHSYEFSYRANRLLGFFADHDELYWNVTGNGWAFPIDRASATVRFDFPVDPEDLEVSAYTGREYETGSDFEARIDPDGSVHVRSTRVLPPVHGLTIAVSWPKGLVAAPTRLDRAGWLLRDNRNLLVALAGLLALFAYYIPVWRQFGRDPEEGVIVTRYEPPAGYSPASLRYIRQMYYDNKVMTAAVLNLAVKGYLRIVRDGDEHVLEKLETGATAPETAAGERELYDALFAESSSIRLKNTNHRRLRRAKEAHRKSLEQDYRRKYFRTNLLLSLPGAAIVIASAIVALTLSGRPPAVIVLAVALNVAVMLFFGWIMRRPTLRGRKLLDELLGFKDYLDVAEKDELNLRNPPEKTPELFEAYLPFALALGVEQRWAEKFAAVLASIRGEDGHGYRPAWYGGKFEAGRLSSSTSSLTAGLGSAIASSASPPGSSSGGGGGGSSGGGGGGGGGGGW